MGSLRTNLVGKAALSAEDLQPALVDMKRKLMERNVAEEIAQQVRPPAPNPWLATQEHHIPMPWLGAHHPLTLITQLVTAAPPRVALSRVVQQHIDGELELDCRVLGARAGRNANC